jgi:hypothetical protein
VDQHSQKLYCWWYILPQKAAWLGLTLILWLFHSPTEVPGAETLLFLPDSARAVLSDMGDCVDREVALSQRDKEIETEAAWQAHFILWTKMKNIPNPCGPHPGYIFILAIYIMYCLHGCNCRNMNGLRADTLQGYALAIGTLFTLQGFKSPIDISNPNNLGGIIITNQKREEDVAAQRSPLSNAIFAELQQWATASHSFDSEQNCMFDVACIGRFIGPRVSKYTQTSPSKIDYHVYPSGEKVIKAFIADNFAFYDKSGNLIVHLDNESVDIVKKVKITWWIQKNHQNGQAITLSADDDHSTICPVCAALWMVLRAQCLGQPDSFPVACHIYKKKCVYLTGKCVAVLFREAAKMIHPNMCKDKLFRFSTHSLRVMRSPQKSRYVSWIHHVAPAMDGELVSNVPAWYWYDPGQA